MSKEGSWISDWECYKYCSDGDAYECAASKLNIPIDSVREEADGSGGPCKCKCHHHKDSK